MSDEADVRAWVRDEVQKVVVRPARVPMTHDELLMAFILGVVLAIAGTVVIIQYWSTHNTPYEQCERACGTKGVVRAQTQRRTAGYSVDPVAIVDTCECQP